jgi:hypothetical protein
MRRKSLTEPFDSESSREVVTAMINQCHSALNGSARNARHLGGKCGAAEPDELRRGNGGRS